MYCPTTRHKQIVVYFQCIVIGHRCDVVANGYLFALFFHNFSSFLGRAGLYLEDLFVLPEYRGKGCGKGLLRELARIACERGCGRMEWVCLDWNKPSIDFYLRLKAEPLQDWTIYRLAGETMKDFAESEG